MGVDEHILVRTLVREHSKLLAFIFSIVRDEHLAEDILQEVSMIAIDKRSEIRDPERLTVWLRRTARFKALRAMEKRCRRPMLMDAQILDLLEMEWERFDGVGTSDLIAILRNCLAKLTPYAQKIIGMRYGENLKSGQIGEQLGKKAHAIYVALTRIHRELAQCINSNLEKLCVSRHE